MANRITIRLLGSARDGGDVRLSEFIEQLEALSEVLRQTERALSGKNSNFIYYKIVDLTHNSPATVVLEPVARPASPVTPRAVTNNFFAGVRAIKEKKAPHGADLAMMESYRALAAPKRDFQRVEILETAKKILPIDSAFSKQVEEIIGPDIYSFGSISGRLERVNFHNALRFVVFPAVGPERIACEFRPDLRKRVKEALDNYVTVTGRFRYKKMDKFPYAIDAKDIDIHEPDDELPTLHSLRGLAPNSTEGMSAEEFVRSIRDANW